MRTVTLGIIALLITVVSSSAYAECYGDAAQAFGCQNAIAPASRAGDLVRFGEEQAPLMPDYYGRNQGYSSDDLVTTDERRSMMRDIILRGGRNAQSIGAQNQAINASQRPLRTFSSRRLRGFQW